MQLQNCFKCHLKNIQLIIADTFKIKHVFLPIAFVLIHFFVKLMIVFKEVLSLLCCLSFFIFFKSYVNQFDSHSCCSSLGCGKVDPIDDVQSFKALCLGQVVRMLAPATIWRPKLNRYYND